MFKIVKKCAKTIQNNIKTIKSTLDVVKYVLKSFHELLTRSVCAKSKLFQGVPMTR